jgi:CBS-domain-containing membrane protein
MQASDVMTSPVITVRPDADVRETAERLLDNRISGLPVVDDAGALIGIVSEGDLMRRAEAGTQRRRPSWWLSLLTDPDAQTRSYVKSHGRRIADVMTARVITVKEDTPLATIAETLEKHRIKRVPVVRDAKLVGIVSRADLLHGLIAGRSAPTPSRDDRTIKATIIDNLAEAGISRHLLNIVVSGGNAHIWGVVQTQDELDAIRIAAEEAPGVKSVACNIDVLPAAARTVLWPD